MDSLERIAGSGPLWLIGLAFFLILLAAFFTGQWLARRHGDGSNDHPGDNYVLTAMLALLGLLIAFTFSLSINRHDTRRQAVIAEGNAISTAWLRATLVEGAAGEALRSALRRYGETRLRLPDAPDRLRVEAESAKAQREVWQSLRAALPGLPAPIGATLVTATTQMFDAAASRKAEREARIPVGVLDMVSLFAVLTTGVLGHVLGGNASRRHSVLSILQLLLLTLALTLILDLDRPWSGAIRISAAPVSEAVAAMQP